MNLKLSCLTPYVITNSLCFTDFFVATAATESAQPQAQKQHKRAALAAYGGLYMLLMLAPSLRPRLKACITFGGEVASPLPPLKYEHADWIKRELSYQ